MNIDNATISSDIPASRVSRLLAFIVDDILAFIVVMCFWFFIIKRITPLSEHLTVLQKSLIVLSFLIQYVLINGYLLHKKGQTIGKCIFKIKIVGKNGQHVSLFRISLLRYFPFTIMSTIPVVSLMCPINVLCIYRKSKYCLHDDIANTKVIRNVSVPF
jgi:uncharacterized RDD family membrane protein YckC